MVAEPERKSSGDIDRILEDLRPTERDLLEAARIGEIESWIKEILVDAGEKDFDQQDRENEATADPEHEGEAAGVRQHAELTEDRDDQDIAEEIHEQHAIGGRGIEHDQRKKADQRDDRQRLLGKAAIEEIEQRDKEERDLDERDMRKTERRDMRVDDGEETIIHHRQRHHDAHKPAVFPNGLWHRPRLWIVKGADAHALEVTDSRQGEKSKSPIRPEGSTSRYNQDRKP